MKNNGLPGPAVTPTDRFDRALVYVVRTPENTAMILALARHVAEHGIDGRFYGQIRKYHHENGKVYWFMDPSPEAATLINRCNEDQTYEARLVAGTLPTTQQRP